MPDFDWIFRVIDPIFKADLYWCLILISWIEEFPAGLAMGLVYMLVIFHESLEDWWSEEANWLKGVGVVVIFEWIE